MALLQKRPIILGSLLLEATPYQEHIPNSHGKIKCSRSAFASCRHARALAACLLLRQEHVYITTTNPFVSTTTNSMKARAKWVPPRIRLRSRNTQPHLNSFYICECVIFIYMRHTDDRVVYELFHELFCVNPQ